MPEQKYDVPTQIHDQWRDVIRGEYALLTGEQLNPYPCRPSGVGPFLKEFAEAIVKKRDNEWHEAWGSVAHKIHKLEVSFIPEDPFQVAGGFTSLLQEAEASFMGGIDMMLASLIPKMVSAIYEATEADKQDPPAPGPQMDAYVGVAEGYAQEKLDQLKEAVKEVTKEKESKYTAALQKLAKKYEASVQEKEEVAQAELEKQTEKFEAAIKEGVEEGYLGDMDTACVHCNNCQKLLACTTSKTEVEYPSMTCIHCGHTQSVKMQVKVPEDSSNVTFKVELEHSEKVKTLLGKTKELIKKGLEKNKKAGKDQWPLVITKSKNKKSILDGEDPTPQEYADTSKVKVISSHLVEYKKTETELFIALTQNTSGHWSASQVNRSADSVRSDLAGFLGYSSEIVRAVIVKVDLDGMEDSLYKIPTCSDCGHMAHEKKCGTSDYDAVAKISVKCQCP